MSCQIPFSSAFKYAIRTTNNLCGIFAQIRLQKDKLDKKRSHITARVLCPWDSPGMNIGVGCHFLLQGIFLTQGLNPGLLYCRQMLRKRT